jgi:alcohol dehydrogenase class IV
MLLASYYAGMCITLSGTNAIHALSYPLGTTFHIPHGQSNAMLLPLVMEWNLQAIPYKTRKIAECFGYMASNDSLNPVQYTVKELDALLYDLGITRSLQRYGIKEEDVRTLVESAFGNRRLMDNNPNDWTKPMIEEIYRTLLHEE